ncbi:hypothetical protein FRC10_004199 [Ceratobasidium sp. 414]|nr:hypothetical protein FRC10_004199 [Ceratobasidium sp. 414]
MPTLPFFGATYKKRTIAILRNPDYDFWEYDNVSIELGRGPWSDILSRLQVVEISVAEEFSEEEV